MCNRSDVQRSTKASPISIWSRTIPTIATFKRQTILDLGPLLLFDNDTEEGIAGKLLTEETRNKRRGQRDIGVVYNPEYERFENYVPTDLTKRYDAFLYIDNTHALHPLHMPEVKEDEDLPETFPTGL